MGLKINKNGSYKDIGELYINNNGSYQYLDELYKSDGNGGYTKIFDAGWDTTVSGTAPLTATNARAKATSWEIDGQSSQTGTPTPTTPVDVRAVGNSGLPSGYKKLEYIQSSGTQYIDTGENTSTDTELEGKFTLSALSNQMLWANNNTATNRISCYLSNTGACNFGDKTSSNNNLLIYLSTTTPSIIKENSDGIFINGTKRVNFGGGTISAGDTMYIFTAKSTGATGLDGKMYYCTIKKNNTLVRNFIPAQRVSDGAIGMYDLCGSICSATSTPFYINAGTGDFTAGPEDTSCVVPVKVSDGTNETTYDITLLAPLQKIGTYKDTIESDGTLTKRLRSYVMTGTESFTDQVASNHRCFFNPPGILNPSGGVSSPDCMSTIGVGNSSGNTANTSFIYDGRFYFVFDNGITFPTLADFTSYLATQYAAGTPVVIYYPLATPTTSTVEVPTISTSKGTNIINVETEISPSNVEITYRKRTQ